MIDRIGEVDLVDRYDPPCLFAADGRDSLPTSPALICPITDDGSGECPQDASLSYLLMIQQAKSAIAVWSRWRGGRSLTPQDKFNAVMYYARHDAYLPTD